MKEIKITKVPIDDVIIQDKKMYNTNNFWVTEKKDRPLDYVEKQRRTHTSEWIDKFHSDDYKKITLDNTDLKWMKEAFKIGQITGEFPKMYSEYLDDTCNKYSNYDFCNGKGSWFIRTDSCSLKYGIHGNKPYNRLNKIIESMVTTISSHKCFDETDTYCNIYFLKWIPELDISKEFRIFVYNNDITAISIQDIYKINEWAKNMDDDTIKNIIKIIYEYFHENIRDKMLYLSEYVMDLALLDDNKPYFIEPNVFGKNYPAGSALFHWVIDEDLLYGTKDYIEYRYII